MNDSKTEIVKSILVTPEEYTQIEKILSRPLDVVMSLRELRVTTAGPWGNRLGDLIPATDFAPVPAK